MRQTFNFGVKRVAQNKKASQENGSTVTRIKATTAPSTKSSQKSASVKEAEVVQASTTKKSRKIPKPSAKGIARPFVAIGRYFSGAWYELKQVRWPTRKATWGLTAAVLLYTAFFVVVVILLDVAFKYLFDLMLGR